MEMHRKHLRLLVLPLWSLLAGVAGCTDDYPMDRPGTWRATGANETNLNQMVASPADLTRGQAAPDARGNAGASAVTRLLQDRRRQLIDTNASTVGATTQSNDSGGAASASTGMGGQ